MNRISWMVAAVLLTCLAIPAMCAQEVIIDNPGATFVGTWSTGTSATDKYGSDYRYCNQSTAGTNTATYTPNIPTTASDWQVYTWFPTVTTSSTGTQFIIHHAGGDATVTISQSTNRGMWVLLGTYTMNAGTGNYARITNYSPSSTRRAIADAMRFYSATAADTTPPVISGVSASFGATYATITWQTDEASTSQVEYGLTQSYGSQTTEDTALVKSHSVSITGLTPGTTYNYRVKSKDADNNLATSGNFTFTTNELTPEFRAIWINTWNNGFLSAAQNTALVNTTKGANYNVLIPEVRKAGDAYYNASPLYCHFCGGYHSEPRASNILDPAPFDPLQDLIDKAHAENMEVHAWAVAYRIWRTNWSPPPADHIWSVHPEWAMMTNTGSNVDGTSYNLDPGVPAVQDYLAKLAMDIVTNYDVDGMNWDYIRYPGTTWGYNDITKQRFYDEYGYYPPTSSSDPNWGVWGDYRRQQVTDLVKRVYLEIMSVKPHVNHNVDTVGWSGGDPNVDFTTTRQYTDVFQNAKSWMEQHIIDTNILMNYKREYDAAQAPDYRLWTNWLATMQANTGRWSVDGQAAYLNSIPDSITQMQVARNAGIGLNTYDFNTTNKDSLPAADFFAAVKASVYRDPAPVPVMTWKTNPTGGIIFGTVTKASGAPDPIYWQWLYKATVSISGPVTLNTVTDATGTYGFIDLPPGTYTVTYSKTGYPNRVISGLELSAGQVIRRDVALGTVTVTSPAGVVVNGWSLFSLPVDPVNPDPASVMNGIDIDGRLYGWNNATQSLTAYDVWSPEAFGNMNVENGYWLDSNSAGAISYEGYPSNATARDIPLSKSGWAIIGCPFTSNKQWPDTAATHGGQTVPLSTAVYTNNWLTSIGYWWDATVQSLSDIGLPEDFPSSETLQPWHGYWIQTNVDDLTLTIQ
ncbi:MAG: family 10 glycosylhydrolase [Armatimonadetes bacterium]|nr:family 10 glycosylhydrolase [Armatimonadota bacterium]